MISIIYTADSLYNNTLYKEYLDIRTKSFIPITKNEYTIKIDLSITKSVPLYKSHALQRPRRSQPRSLKVVRVSCYCSSLFQTYLNKGSNPLMIIQCIKKKTKQERLFNAPKRRLKKRDCSIHQKED